MAQLKGTTYNELDRVLGRKQSVVIGNNTTAERDNDGIVVRLHGHPIATLTERSVFVRDAGYQTVTTKERINQFLPARFRVFQKSGQWYVNDRGAERNIEWQGAFWINLDTNETCSYAA